MNKTICFLVIVGLILGCNSRPVAKKTEQLLQKELDAYVQVQGIPGASFSMVFSDEEHLAVAAGYADKEAKIAMNPSDRMLSGSIGKTYVAGLVFKLIEEGKLKLKDSVKTFFAREEWFRRIPNADDLTVRMLLSHTSGIPRYVFKREVWQTLHDEPDKIWTGKDRLAYVFDDKPLHPAGQGWGYSDTNYIILGMIVEKITGEGYYELLIKQLLDPLKLTATTPSDHRDIKGLIPGYTTESFQKAFQMPAKMVANGKYAFNPQMEWTGGGLVSTPYELAKWARIFYGGRFVSTESTKLISTPGPHPAKLADEGQYGMGAIIWNQDDPLRIGHSGFMPGYISVMQYVPEYDLAMAIQINTDDAPKEESLHAFMDRMLKLVKGKS